MSCPPLPVIHFRKACGLRLVLARGQHAAAGNADEGAGILVAEVVQGGVVAVLAGLRLIAEPVIVVDHSTVDFAGIDGLHGNAVAADRP